MCPKATIQSPHVHFTRWRMTTRTYSCRTCRSPWPNNTALGNRQGGAQIPEAEGGKQLVQKGKWHLCRPMVQVNVSLCRPLIYCKRHFDDMKAIKQRDGPDIFVLKPPWIQATPLFRVRTRLFDGHRPDSICKSLST